MARWRVGLSPVTTPMVRAWWRVKRGMTLGVRVAAFDAEGRVVLVRHTYTAGWHLPGGGVERGETLEAAARKEAREEAGIALDAPVLHGVFLNPGFRGDHVAVFVAGVAGPAPTDSAGEIAECGWFAPTALPDGTTAATLRRLDEIVRGVPPAPLW